MQEDIEKKLTNKHTQPTSMRILIYDILASRQEAISLTDIERYLPKADRTTIYRTLKTFEEKGIIHSIQEQSTTKYKLCGDACDEQTHKDWHLHLYCKICKQVTCQEDIQLTQPIAANFRIDEVRFFAKGICAKCLEETLQ